MKRTVKVLALILVLIMAVTAFVGCKKRLSGTYEGVNSAGGAVLILFDGDNFTYKNSTTGTELKGTYEIETHGEEHFITMICEESITTYGGAKKLENPYSIFEDATLRIGEDYISIGSGADMKKYTKHVNE